MNSAVGLEDRSLVEGKTETAVKEVLKKFLDSQAAVQGRPRVGLKTKPLDSKLLSDERLRDQVAISLRDPEVECVVALIDVYPAFPSAQAAKTFLRDAVGANPQFHAHAAQFDTEAWLLPFWPDICRKLRVQRQPPGANPEQIDRQNPPSRRLTGSPSCTGLPGEITTSRETLERSSRAGNLQLLRHDVLNSGYSSTR